MGAGLTCCRVPTARSAMKIAYTPGTLIRCSHTRPSAPQTYCRTQRSGCATSSESAEQLQSKWVHSAGTSPPCGQKQQSSASYPFWC
eukprot:4081215-Prymnesium_polylepis.1